MLTFTRRGNGDTQAIGSLNLPEWLCGLLRSRGMDTEEKARLFLNPSLSQLHNPMRMADMDKAVSLLTQARDSGRKVMVYGDYDCDGVCAAAIMLETLAEFGVEADFRIPSRHQEGYGLNSGAVREIASAGWNILLTVDCGVTNHEEVRLARLLGMTVIVTDHHQLAETPSPADAVLNPLCGDYPFRRLCGAGVALKLRQALLGEGAVERCLDLAALATVADLVPLIDENRVIVAEGLRCLSAGRRPGLQKLMTLAEVKAPVSAGHVAFRLAPRINASGRLADASPCVELLTTENEERAAEIALMLHQLNEQRQAMQTDITAQAEQKVSAEMDFYADRAIVVMGEDWDSGIIGLAAGRLCEKYHYPAVVLSKKEDGTAVGSCRSIPGVNIHALLTRCADLFIRYGGHEMAAGLTIRAELVPELKRRLNLYIDESCDPRCYLPQEEYDLQLPLGRVSLNMVEELELIQPVGFGNPAPQFLGRGLEVQQLKTVGRDNSHLKLLLSEGDEVRPGIAFRQAQAAGKGWRYVDALFVPEKNVFMDTVSVQLNVKALTAAEGEQALPPEESLFSSLLREMTALAEAEMPASGAEEAFTPLTEAALKQLLAGGMGVLCVAHTRGRAAAAAALGLMDVALAATEEERPFNLLLLNPDIPRLRDVWQHAVLLDGCLLPGEAQALREKCPRAKLHRLSPNPTLKQALRELLPTVEQLRALYVSASSRQRSRQMMSLGALCQDSGLTQPQAHIGLTAFREVGLCAYETSPLVLRVLPRQAGDRADILSAPILKYLRGISL